MDRRAGYQRQADEPATYTCRHCNAEIRRGINGTLVHTGDCVRKQKKNHDFLLNYRNQNET